MRSCEYATISVGTAESQKQQPNAAAAVAMGVALGLGLVLMGNTAATTLLHQPVGTRAAATRVPIQQITTTSQMQPMMARASMVAANRISGSAMETDDYAAPAMASSLWSSALTFLGGCAVAVAVALRPRSSAANVVPDTKEISMATIAGHREVKEPPAVLGLNPDPNSLVRRWEQILRKGQDSICKAIEECDGQGKFRTDAWLRESGGGGVSRVMTGGKVWEKAGIGLSVIYGMMPTETLMLARERQANYAKDLKPGDKVPFFTCGLSCVMHPRDPHCPTMHFNYRYFSTEAGDWWFGGGTDITPAYLDEEDMKHFHGTYKKVCDKHDPAFYPKFKKWADEYFLIKHRGETRGLGGIFFDDLNDRDPEKIMAFAEECLNTVVPAYVPIIEKNKNKPFTEEQKRWQLLRRGRYVEFNLIYDRGFIFGLKSGIGRVETMMMTLPETGRWEYNHHPAPGSEEEKILKLFQNSPEWV